MIPFFGRHYPPYIILQCVRWYVSYAPLLEQKSRKYKRPVHRSCWRMDETYIKIKGHWRYLYRAVDKYGATIDFLETKKRDVNAAKTFFRKALMGKRCEQSGSRAFCQ